MILYKHIFYIISRWVKKYDGKLWDVGDTYFIYGGMFLALVIFTTVVCIVDWMGLLFFDGILRYVYSDQFTLFYKLFPLSVGVGTTFYLYKKNDGNIRNCDKIYKEIDILDRKKRGILRLYKLYTYRLFSRYLLVRVFWLEIILQHNNKNPSSSPEK